MSRPPVQVPIRNSDGQIVWVNKYHSRRTLGDTTETLSTVQSGLKLASTAQDASGAQPTNKTLNDISKVSAAIAGTVGVVIPIVGIVAGIVSVAAKILSGVFGGGPTSEQQLRTFFPTCKRFSCKLQPTHPFKKSSCKKANSCSHFYKPTHPWCNR